MKNVKAYVRTTLTAGLILAAAVLGGCSKSAAGSSAADTAAASSGTESAASADASNSNKKELKYGKAAGPYTVLFEDAIKPILEKEGYTETSVQHTLHPAASAQESLGGRNMTSVKDCGTLLEKIYKGECVSKEASEEMLNLLSNQENTWKIPQGLPDGIKSANKTGETDQDQHDIAIVYGEKTTYILCVMSENCPESTAVTNIQNISKIVYNYLNL